MNKLKALLAAVLLLAPACSFAASLGFMRVSFMQGDVQIKTAEIDEWGVLSTNAPLAEGDQLWVPEGGKAELQLNTGTYIRLDENSALQILAIDNDSSQFYLSQGRAYVSFDALDGSALQFDTTHASSKVENRAVFGVDLGDRSTEVAVYKGYVEVENDRGETRVNAGERFAVGKATGSLAPLGPPDEWARWNKARSERVAVAGDQGSRYLPPELKPYASDFESSGRWVSVPDYGTVWTPTVGVGPDWAPYREGRWVWRGGEYVWVAYEPWGWAPYHYGRWAFVPRFGWCWVPPARGAVYWSPGYVAWVRTPEYVAWVPLAPGEIYYGRGYHGPHSVNVTQVNVTNVRVTNVYKNMHANNGVTVVQRQTFATGAPKVVHVNKQVVVQKIFVKENITVKGPEIKPERQSYFPVSKAIPQAKLPPERIRRIEVKELKQERPFFKERGRREKPGGIRGVSEEDQRQPGEGRGSNERPGRRAEENGRDERFPRKGSEKEDTSGGDPRFQKDSEKQSAGGDQRPAVKGERGRRDRQEGDADSGGRREGKSFRGDSGSDRDRPADRELVPTRRGGGARDEAPAQGPRERKMRSAPPQEEAQPAVRGEGSPERGGGDQVRQSEGKGGDADGSGKGEEKGKKQKKNAKKQKAEEEEGGNRNRER